MKPLPAFWTLASKGGVMETLREPWPNNSSKSSGQSHRPNSWNQEQEVGGGGGGRVGRGAGRRICASSAFPSNLFGRDVMRICTESFKAPSTPRLDRNAGEANFRAICTACHVALQGIPITLALASASNSMPKASCWSVLPEIKIPDGPAVEALEAAVEHAELSGWHQSPCAV